MSARRTYAQAAASQAAPVSYATTGFNPSHGNIDTRTQWAKDETFYKFSNARERQVLNQKRKLEASITVNSAISLPVDVWESDRLKWSKEGKNMFLREVNTFIHGYSTLSKEETECTAYFIMRTLAASHVRIMAPSHPFTFFYGTRIGAEPHVTMEVSNQYDHISTLHVHHKIVQRGRLHHPQYLEITWVTRAVWKTRHFHGYLVYTRNS